MKYFLIALFLLCACNKKSPCDSLPETNDEERSIKALCEIGEYAKQHPEKFKDYENIP